MKNIRKLQQRRRRESTRNYDSNYKKTKPIHGELGELALKQGKITPKTLNTKEETQRYNN